MKFQISLLANQPNRFRPLKFHGVQNLIILYQVDRTSLLPRCLSFVIGERIQDQDYMCHTQSLFFLLQLQTWVLFVILVLVIQELVLLTNQICVCLVVIALLVVVK